MNFGVSLQLNISSATHYMCDFKQILKLFSSQNGK